MIVFASRLFVGLGRVPLEDSLIIAPCAAAGLYKGSGGGQEIQVKARQYQVRYSSQVCKACTNPCGLDGYNIQFSRVKMSVDLCSWMTTGRCSSQKPWRFRSG